MIKLSKASTIDTLRQLSPVLGQLQASGDDFVKGVNVALTYPFVDDVVGRDPQVARNLQMGDYTNLDIKLDLSLDDQGSLPSLPTGLPTSLPTAADQPPHLRDHQDPRRRGRLPPERRHHQQGVPEGPRPTPRSWLRLITRCKKAQERRQPGVPGAQRAAQPADRRHRGCPR